MFWGRIIGAIIGVGAGGFGVVLGFLIGWLVDQTIKVNRQNASLERFLKGSGSISGTKAHGELFVATVGIMMRVGCIDGVTTIRQVEVMRGWLVDRFDVSERGNLGLSRVIDEAYRLRADLDLEHACDVVVRSFNQEAVKELFASLVDIAEADGHGMTAANRRILRVVGAHLGISEETLKAAESRPRRLDELACSILGLPTDAKEVEVRKVYRHLAAQFHPDANPGLTEDQLRQSEEAFVRINAAYVQLMGQLREDE